MKVLIVEPGKYPREADIEPTLEAEQAVVGGPIEAVCPWRAGACGLFSLSEIIQQARRRTNERHF